MKPFATLIVTAFAASPALAHGGAHLHPHGYETPLLVMGLGLIALAGALAYKR